MTINLKSPGLIILNQFKSMVPQENKHHFWYITTEGIQYFNNNTGVFSELRLDTNSLLKFIVDQYKSQFEFTFDNLDLDFFSEWQTLQIKILSHPTKSCHSNVSRFLNQLQIKYGFDETTQRYQFVDFPHISTQLQVYELINESIMKDLSILFQEKNIVHYVLTNDEFTMFDQYKDKMEFFEKLQFKNHMENQFPPRQKTGFNKI